MNKLVNNVAILTNIAALVRGTSIKAIDKLSLKHEVTTSASNVLVTNENVTNTILTELLAVKAVDNPQPEPELITEGTSEKEGTQEDGGEPEVKEEIEEGKGESEETDKGEEDGTE